MKLFLIISIIFSLSSCSTFKSSSIKIKQVKDHRAIASLGQCGDHFAKKELEKGIAEKIRILGWSLQEESLYSIHLKNTTSIKKVEFIGIEERPETLEIILVYKYLNDDQIHEVDSKKVSSLSKILKNEEKIAKTGKLIELPIVASELSKIIFKPYKKLASRESVEVVGTLLTNKKLGETILDNTLKFDESMTQLGFTKPSSTRIIINDKPLLPNLAGPFSLKPSSINLWDGKSKKVIAMNPIFRKTNVIKSETVLYHERVHAILYRTYSDKAFINRSNTFQEAFADFISANFSGSPQIGLDATKKGVAIRDIEKRTTSSKKKINNVSKITGHGYHNDSLLVSNLLWKIREKLGVEETSRQIKPIIDNLNSYDRSFATNESTSTLSKVEEKRQRFLNDFVFFLATLKKMAQQNPTLKSLEDIADESIKELSLNSEQVEEVFHNLNPSIMDLSHRETTLLKETEKIQTIMVAKLAKVGLAIRTAGFVVQGYIIYEVFIDKD